jgi:hypothetical protein
VHDAGRRRAGRVSLPRSAQKMIDQPFSHLAATRISGAEDKYPVFYHFFVTYVIC